MIKNLLITLFIALNLFAIDDYKTNKSTNKIIIDGKMDELDWQKADEIPFLFEVDPQENIPATQNTIAKIIYDNENIYFGFICSDTEMKNLRAKISKRDNIFMDDFVIVFLDTYNDGQKTYELMVNPFGIQGDAIKTSSNEDVSFDLIWESAAKINENNWVVEIKLPFSSFRFPSSDVHCWSLVLGRVYPRASKTTFAPTKFDRNNPCLMCQAINLTGIENISQKSKLEFLPYIQSSQANVLSNSNDRLEAGKLKGRFGGGIKYSTSDFTIDGVVNPDFSQIESDAVQISVNSNFGLFYPELRPFFIEGLDLFQSRNRIFYSRTINDPLFALKLIGKKDKISYGYLASNDRHSPFLIPGAEESFTYESNIQSFTHIGKVRYDFGEEQGVGLSFTNRILNGGYNAVSGIDWHYKIVNNLFFSGNYFYTNTKEINNLLFESTDKYSNSNYTLNFDNEKFDGHLFGMRIGFENRDYEFNFRVREVSPLFQAANSFVNKINTREVHLSQVLNFYPVNSFVDNFSLYGEEGLIANYSGIQKEAFAVFGLRAQLKGQTNVNLSTITLNRENWHNTYFNMKPRIMLNVMSSPYSFLNFGFMGSYGEAIYRDVIPELGVSGDVGGWVSYKPNSNFTITLNQTYSELKKINTEELYYSGFITRVYNTYSFDENMFLRLIAQYDGFSKLFNFFPLFTYQINPFSVFYLGTTSDVSQIGDLNIYRETTRQYFLKFQYLINTF